MSKHYPVTLMLLGLCVALWLPCNLSYLKYTASDDSMRSEERLAGEKSERKSRKPEGKEPLGDDVGTEQEMDSQTKEGLQALQETKWREESPDDCPLMHTAATRGAL